LKKCIEMPDDWEDVTSENWRCQAQISIELQLLGEPNALISRSTHGCASDSAVPELVVTPKATASEPLSAAMRRNAAAALDNLAGGGQIGRSLGRARIKSNRKTTMARLEGRKIIITGGASGIGRATAGCSGGKVRPDHAGRRPLTT
jgi:hypothetical protein